MEVNLIHRESEAQLNTCKREILSFTDDATRRQQCAGLLQLMYDSVQNMVRVL
jgi:hypothetical protein